MIGEKVVWVGEPDKNGGHATGARPSSQAPKTFVDRRWLAIAIAWPLLACDSGTSDVFSPPMAQGGSETDAGAPMPDSGGEAEDGGAGDAPEAEAVVPFDGGPTDIPLAVAPLMVALPEGGMAPGGFRLALQFALGDAGPVQGWLDTGSAGIQVLQSAVPPDALAAIALGSTRVSEEFGSGITATGVVGTATVTLGDRTTPVPIPIVVYQNFTCAAGGACAMATEPLEDALFNGYSAIVGVGLRSAPTAVAPGLGSPIPQLPGQPSFIVEAPDFGGTAGILHIGPPADEVAAYPTIQLSPQAGSGPLLNGTPAWNDLGIPGCVDDQPPASSGLAAQDYCATMLFDTGAPETLLSLTGESTSFVFPPGSNVSVDIGQTGAPVAQFDLVVGSPQQIGLDVFFAEPALAGTANLINLGLTAFFRYNVYVNPVEGVIGLVPH